MNSYKVAQVSSDCSPLLEAEQAESLGIELLEMVPSREDEIKLKEYREDAVSTFIVDDYVRLEFKGSTFTGSWKSFSSPKISSTFLVVIAIVSNGIVIYVWMMKTVLLDVKSTNTIVQIKSKIGALEGIGNRQKALFFAGIMQMFERKIGRLSTLFLAMEEGFLALVSSLVLKIWNLNEHSDVVGAFNCQGTGWCRVAKKNLIHDHQPGTVSGVIRAQDVKHLARVTDHG
uniref:Uncharacterized protein n=1 Tax=Zea mays TaxID=4577 RepID=A0A804LSS9_MAIZE